MKMEHFHYLLEISRLRSISAAARSLHIGQTTLSAIVKVTESEVGFPIFQRTPNGVIPTPIGEHFMSLAWEINVKYEELIALKNRTSGGSPSITLLLCPALGSLSLPLAERFYRFDLHGNLTYEEASSETVGTRILENAANIGLAYLTEEEIQDIEKKGDLNVERLLEDEICLLASTEHPLASRGEIDLEEVQDERLVTASKKMINDKVLGNVQSLCKRITALSSHAVVCRSVLEQNLLGFIPRFVASEGEMADRSKYSLVTLRKTPRTNKLYICLLTCKNRNLRYQERILAVCVREYFQSFRNGQEEKEEPAHES